LCEALLTRDPKARIGEAGKEDIEKHDFFKDFDFECLRDDSMTPLFKPENAINANKQDDIGGEEERFGDRRRSSSKKDKNINKDFEEFDDVNVDCFYDEVIASLEWAKEHGDLRKSRKSSVCSIS
jgi:hypothetical protein